MNGFWRVRLTGDRHPKDNRWNGNRWNGNL
jgi:hypothetical protein